MMTVRWTGAAAADDADREGAVTKAAETHAKFERAAHARDSTQRLLIHGRTGALRRPRHNIEGINVMTLREEFDRYGVTPNGLPYRHHPADKGWSGEIEDDLERQIALATEWLRRVQRTKTVNKSTTSYGLKHEVENWHKHVKIVPDNHGHYLCNGCFIVAAYRLGFIVQPIPDSPNAWINVSNKSINGAWDGCDQPLGKLKVKP